MSWPTTSRHERGYGTHWDKLRLHVLRRDKYLCQCPDCSGSGRLTEANEVDHVISKATWLRTRGTLEGVDSTINLQAINHDCHVRKTQRETGKTPRPTVSADGWSRT